MSTLIEWAEETWNPIRHRWHAEGKAGHWCLKLSTGCEHCYAGRMQAVRFGGEDYRSEGLLSKNFTRQLVEAGSIYLDEKALLQPLRWQTPRRIFVGSMTDVFLNEWPDAWLTRLYAVMRLAPRHTFIVLTKRPTIAHAWYQTMSSDRLGGAVYRLLDTLPNVRKLANPRAGMGWPLPNVWLGVTVESDAYTWRAKVLADIPAAVRWVSAEPLLGPLPSLLPAPPRDCPDCGAKRRWEVVHSGALDAVCLDPRCGIRRANDDRDPGLVGKLDWLVVGGESGGPLERRLISSSAQSLGWVRDLRDRALASGTSFFFKQWGGATPKAGGRVLDGRTWDEYPTARAAVPA